MRYAVLFTVHFLYLRISLVFSFPSLPLLACIFLSSNSYPSIAPPLPAPAYPTLPLPLRPFSSFPIPSPPFYLVSSSDFCYSSSSYSSKRVLPICILPLFPLVMHALFPTFLPHPPHLHLRPLASSYGDDSFASK